MAVMGFPDPPPVKQPGIYDKLLRGLLGTPQSYGGLLSAEDQKAIQQQQLLALGSNLLQASGPSPYRVSTGQAIGQGLAGAQQTGRDAGHDMLQTMLLKTKLQPKPAAQPASVAEYEYAKQNGYKGSFQDWTIAGGQSSRPSAVQEWEFYNALQPQQQAQYLEMKRNPNVFFGKVNEVPTIAKAPTAGMPAVTTPLSTVASEAAAAGQVKQAESAGGALGTAQGNIQGGIETKGSNAVSTKSTLDLAEPLIDIATGSLAGSARDKVFAAFGSAPDSAQAIAQLKVMQANLMTSMPRMEGPQSDRDVDLYREAAGQIGDPTIPSAIKKAAVKTIRNLQDKYIERAHPQATKRIRVDAQGNVIGN